MARHVTRDELVLIIEELDRGEVEREQLQQMVEALELELGDVEAVTLLQDEELSAEDIADQLVGYPERDI